MEELLLKPSCLFNHWFSIIALFWSGWQRWIWTPTSEHWLWGNYKPWMGQSQGNMPTFIHTGADTGNLWWPMYHHMVWKLKALQNTKQIHADTEREYVKHLSSRLNHGPWSYERATLSAPSPHHPAKTSIIYHYLKLWNKNNSVHPEIWELYLWYRPGQSLQWIRVRATVTKTSGHHHIIWQAPT